jgi:hypothetical protein
MAEKPSVLNPEQLTRIEAVHRGFLYQHLYAAACMLQATGTSAISIVVEADEDVEIVGPKRRLYLQVKTRGQPLVLGDIDGALDRFAKLRQEHIDGKRAGIAQFAIIANVPPGPKLAERIADKDWPADTSVYWPGNPPKESGLPEPWKDISEGVAFCSAAAAKLPFGSLVPDTLIWKLAGQVQLASAGALSRVDHSFRVEDFPALFEQLVVQLQELPAPPTNYRPQQGEPLLKSEARLRLIKGFSGAGKTAWIGQVAQHTSENLAYFDVGDNPGTAIAIPLGRELAARFFGSGGAIGKLLLPGATGVEMLRAIGNRLHEEKTDVIVVIDNSHRASAEELRALTDHMPHVRFILLAQPGENTEQLQILLKTAPELLQGWTTDTIAAEVASSNCRADYGTCEKLRELTGGLPFYVQNAANIAAAQYGGELRKFCDELWDRTHDVRTALELILARVFEGLPAPVRDCVAILCLADVPLKRVEAEELLSAVFGIDKRDYARMMRDMRSAGVIEVFGGDRLKVHDALRVLGKTHLDVVGKEVAHKGLSALSEILLRSIVAEHDLAKLSLFLRVAGELGNIKLIVEVATDEIYHEMGLIEQLTGLLEAAASSTTIPPGQRFAAHDGLVLADFKRRDIAKATERLNAMGQLIKDHGLDEDDRLTFEMKSMNLAALKGDVDSVLKKLEDIPSILPDKPAHIRVFKYNAAHALFDLQMPDACVAITEELIKEYYEVLGLKPADVFMKNAAHIFSVMKKGDHSDDLKRLADCLYLQAHALEALGRQERFERLHAMKFYLMARALDSYVKVGQELVDEFVGRNDYKGARDVLEGHLLPVVLDQKLVSHIVPVRSQYAVVLAFDGEHDAAAAEMAKLAPYESGLSVKGQRELQNQRRLIARLKLKPPAPQWELPGAAQIAKGLEMATRAPYRSSPSSVNPLGALGWPWVNGTQSDEGDSAPSRKMGRNERCHCGSGKKFKHCHGVED